MADVIGQLVVQMAADTAKFRSDMQDVKRHLDNVSSAGQVMRRIFETFSGVSLANIAGQLANFAKEAVTAGFEMAQAAEKAEYAFKKVADQVGVSATALRTALQNASGGTADMTETLQAATRGLRESLSGEQLGRLMEIARAQSIETGQTVTQTFEQITVAVANGSERMLKQMGIVIDGDRALRDYARTLGTQPDLLNEAGRAQAYYAAVVEKTKNNIADTSSEAVKHKETLERMATEGRQHYEKLGKAASDYFFATIAAAKNALTELEQFNNDILIRMQQGQSVIGALISKWAGQLPGRPPIPGTAGLPNFTDLGALGGPLPAGGGVLAGALGERPPLTRAQQIDTRREDELRKLAAASVELAEALGKLKTAQAALGLETDDTLKLMQGEFEAIARETEARLRENDVLQDVAKARGDITGQASAAAAREGILSDAMARQYELLKKINEEIYQRTRASGARANAITKEMEAQTKQTEQDRENRKGAEERQRDLEMRMRQTEEELNRPMEDKSQEAFLVTLPNALNANKAAAESFGLAFDKVGADLDAVTEAIRVLNREGDKIPPRLQEQYERLKLVKDIGETLFDGLRNALAGTVQGILQGTQTISQAFANMGRNIAASLLQSGIDRILKLLQAQVERFLNWLFETGLIQKGLNLAVGAISGIFAPASPLPAGSFPEVGGGPIQMAQHGGIFTKPTLTLLGEAGPEAVVPMNRLGSGGGGTSVQVNIYNQASNVEVTQQRRTTMTGSEIHDIVIREMRRMVGSGEMEGVMAPYALRRVPTNR